MSTIVEKLNALAQPVIEGMGYEFVGLEYLPMGHASLLRIYIDTNGGVTVDDCVEVSRQISVVLDVEDPIASNYTLEVSSPGLNRPLFSASDYARFTGRKAKIRLLQMLEGRRNFKGIIHALEEDEVVLEDMDGKIFHLPVAMIEKGNLLVDN